MALVVRLFSSSDGPENRPHPKTANNLGVDNAQVKCPVNVQRIALRIRVRASHSLSRGAASSRAISQMLHQGEGDAGRRLARQLMRECRLTSRQPVAIGESC